MSAQADAALSFDRAGFTYAGAREPALADVSLSVPAGQCVVLTGGSGCGKTTLTRLANGLIPVSYDGELAGSVRIAGKDAGSWEMDALCRRVGSVFQNPRSQFFNLDTTSEVAFGCENLGLARRDAPARGRRLRFCWASSTCATATSARSGGQRQMVAIASVCAMGPDVFVLDEPTASLDVGAMLQLAEAVARLKAAGKTVLVAEHRLWWLAGIADRVVVMRGGRVVRDADAAAFARIGEDERARPACAPDLARVSPARRGDGSAASGALPTTTLPRSTRPASRRATAATRPCCAGGPAAGRRR